jgi:PAS domain S-box-containing protein
MKAASTPKKSSVKGKVKDELVSSNKELETLKEEKTSDKQELTTNQELQTRNDLLIESYDYIEAVLATIHEPMLVLDKNIRVKSANKTFYKIFNVKEEETEGMLLYDLGNRQWNIPSLRDLLEDLLLKNTHFHDFEITHTFPLIGEKTMLLNGSRIIQKMNHEELILLAISDITEQATARKKIEDSEKRYNTMLMQSPFALAIMKGKNQVITFANEKMKATWGKGNNVEGKPLIEVLPELKDSPFPNLLDEVYKTGIPFHANDVLAPKHINGQKDDVYYDFVYQPYREADGTVSGVTIIATEVTAAVKVKKALEAQHEVEQKALKLVEDSEKRYNLMLMKSPFAFAVLKGKKMVIALANDSVKEMWGKGNDLEGKPLLEVLPELKDSEFPDLLDKVYTTGIPFSGEELLAPVFRNGKLEDVYFNFVYQPYLEADETISGVTIIAYEVTSSVIVKKALEAQRDAELKALMQVEETNVRYYTMLMESPFAFAVMKGKDMTVTLANDLIKEFWGKGQDVEGKTLLEILPEIKDQPFPEMIDKVYTTGIPVYANEILGKVTYNGQLKHKYFNVVFQPYYEGDNSISGVTQIAYDVTEMVLARKKIEDSDKRYNMMLMHSPFTFVVLKGKDLVVAFANDRIKGVWGRGNDIEGKSLLNLMPELKDTSFPALLDKVRTSGVPFHGVEVQSPKNLHGHVREEYFNFVFQPYLEADQTISGITIIGNDVTEQVMAKRKIEESEERFRSLADNVPIHIFIIEPNAEATISYWNKNWLNYTGQTTGEAGGRTWDRVVHPDDIPLIMDVYVPAFEKQEPYFLPAIRIRRHDGEYRWHSVQANPRFLPNREFMGFIGIGFDIHEQKIAQDALKLSEEHFRLMADLMPSKISNANAAGDVTYFNKHWLTFSGYTFEELRDFGYHKMMHQDELPEFQQRLQHAVKTNTDCIMEMRFKNKEGDYIWHLNIASPVNDENGNHKMWVGVTTEMQYQKEKRDELELAVAKRTSELSEANEELKKMNIELEAFTYVSSHDLQEPLRKIRTIAGRILEKENQNLSDSGKTISISCRMQPNGCKRSYRIYLHFLV